MGRVACNATKRPVYNKQKFEGTHKCRTITLTLEVGLLVAKPVLELFTSTNRRKETGVVFGS